MWMTDYIAAVKRHLRDDYRIKPTGGTLTEPTFAQVPDGEYPMTIKGQLDHVRIVNGQIECCRFDAPERAQGKEP